MKNLEPYINIREEMEMIKEKQQEIFLAAGSNKMSGEASRYVWKLQIVWEYLRNKLLLDDEAPSKTEYLN